MKIRKPLIIILFFCIVTIGINEVNSQSWKDKNRIEKIEYNKSKDRTTVYFKGGGKMICDGKWDKHDIKRFERKMRKLEDKLKDLEHLEINIPELKNLEFELDNLDIELDKLDIELDHLDLDLSDMEIELESLENMDFDFDFDFSELEEAMEDWGHKFNYDYDHRVPEIYIDVPDFSFDYSTFPDIQIDIPDIEIPEIDIHMKILDKELEKLKGLDIYIPNKFDRGYWNSRMWDKSSVKSLKKRKVWK